MIPLAQLHEPATPARAAMDDDKLNSLVVSIRQLGILEPLIVFPDGDGTFEICAGHRRLLAARIAGLAQAPCLVEPNSDRAAAVKIHENLEREELNPAEEAVFYLQLYQKLGEDTEAVAATVKRSRDYIETRLLLARGDTVVFSALLEGKIALGVATELNRFARDQDRHFHLDYCVRTGASVRVVREWRSQANSRAELQAGAPAAETPSIPNTPPSPESPPIGPLYAGMAKPHELSSSEEARACLFCGEQHQEFQMYRKFVCVPCADRHLTRPEAEPAARRGGDV